MKAVQIYRAFLIGSTILFIVGMGFPVTTMKQLGALGIVATILYTPVLFLNPVTQAKVIRNTKRYAAGFFVFMLIFFVSGELALRLWFWNGASFSTHGGPIVKRFERHFEFNHYDGPSRGPEIVGNRKSNSVRVLVQGDSITWGMGIKHEHELFTNLLLKMLRRNNPDTEMAVMAGLGREIDGHLTQIAKWGEEIDPDIIIYQWYINDVLLDRKDIPRSPRFLRRVFFHHKMMQHSYFWFFLNYNLDHVLPKENQRYWDYFSEHFSSDTPKWKRFVSVFRAWAREATSLTPKVLVVLYPTINSEGRPNPNLQTIYNRFANLCEEQDLQVLDLWHSFGELQGDLDRIEAGNYDYHPSAEVHKRIAEGIYSKLKYVWSNP